MIDAIRTYDALEKKKRGEAKRLTIITLQKGISFFFQLEHYLFERKDEAKKGVYLMMMMMMMVDKNHSL